MKFRRYLILAVILILPTAAFAESAVGVAAFYNAPELAGDEVDIDNLNVEQLSIGGNARLKLSLFYGEALILGSFGDLTSGDVFLNAGLAFDIGNLMLSAGFGPKFSYIFDEEVFESGYSLKFNGDLLFGTFSLGISYILDVTAEDGFDIQHRSGLLGLSVLFW